MLIRFNRILFEANADGGQGSGNSQGDGDGQSSGNQQQAGQQGSRGAGEQNSSDQQPGPVPYERFKSVNDELKALKGTVEKMQAAQKAAADKEAADQGKWRELAEKRESELKAERQARTRLEVAAKKGIPSDLAARLQGETAEEMEKDADLLLQHLKPATGPGVPPAGRGGTPATVDVANMTAAEIRKLPADKKMAAMRGE